MAQYNLLEIYSIKENLKEYILDESVTEKISELFTLLNITNSRTKNVRKDKNNYNENGKWIKKELFKPTQIEKKEGIEEELDNLRALLNKLVENNYEEQKDKIIDCVKNIFDIDDDEKHIKVMERFYTLIINNQRYSKTYSQVYLILLDKYLVLEEYQGIFINRYNDIIHKIEYIDPDENYDEYCRINKLNFQRKCLLCFIVSCVECEIYSFNELLHIINSLFDMLDNNLKSINHQNTNEEIVENIFTVMQQGRHLILNEVCKYDIIDKIKNYSILNLKDNLGYSNRMKFKMLDILDLYK
jgi:hypothetical protein